MGLQPSVCITLQWNLRWYSHVLYIQQCPPRDAKTLEKGVFLFIEANNFLIMLRQNANGFLDPRQCVPF